MDSNFASQTLDRKEGRQLKTPKSIPNHVNGHRSFDIRLTNGAVRGGGGGDAGVLFAPAWTDPYSIIYSNVGDLGYHVQPPPPQPLLPLPPLPLSKSYNSDLKAHSYPPPNNSKGSGKPNKWSSSSSSTRTSLVPSPLTPRKSPPKSKPRHKKDQKNSSKPAATPMPDPAELPRNGFKGNLNSGKHQVAAGSDVEFSGPSVYILAPPPSSLPLPSFALRPKLSCNAEAAASGICTNDGLRQIQRFP